MWKKTFENKNVKNWKNEKKMIFEIEKNKVKNKGI